MVQAADLLEDLSDFKDADALLTKAKNVTIITEAVEAYVVALTVVIA